MGASTSKNISHAVTTAIAKVSSDIIQNTNLSVDQSQIISIRDVAGDVVIQGNRFTQKATINMKALLDALSKEENQQKILLNLAQESKAITSGLNVAQFSSAQNTMNTLINATISMLSTIAQTCSVFANQFQTVTIARVTGGVRIENNVFEQVYDILQNCSEKAVAENRSIQDLAAKLDQKASAASEGLSAAFLAVIAFLVLGTPVLGGLLLGRAFLKVAFPVFVAVGCVLIALYFYNTEEEMKLVGFSTLIHNSDVCNAALDHNANAIYPYLLQSSQFFAAPATYDSAINAALACKEDASCVAFDWKGLDVSKTGIGTPIPPTTTFYASVSKDCRGSLKEDNLRILASPAATSGTRPPTAETVQGENGDIYLDTTTGDWYQRADDWPTGWKPMGSLVAGPFSGLSWGSAQVPPRRADAPLENEVYVYFNAANPMYFHVYRYTKERGWLEEKKLRGPGPVPATPAAINTSGFKETRRPKKWMLYTGLASLVVGAVGTAYTLSKEPYEACNTYPFSFKKRPK